MEHRDSLAAPPPRLTLTGGVLLDRFTKNLQNLFLKIDTAALADVYAHEHDSGYAEPEFCGKFIDTAIAFHRYTGERDFLDRAGAVVRSIVAHQRADGYLGTYRRGVEFDTFGVWNQQFTIRGLLSYFLATADQAALDAACRGADFLVAAFLVPGGQDILLAGNQGIQHSCILGEMARLYALTGRGTYLDFCHHVIQRWESSNLRLVSQARRWFGIGCVKAAEMLICYQGLVELWKVAGDGRYLDAARQYWDAIQRSQIGPTGCGSVAENWWMVGNRPALLTNDISPNENCVAVGWMKLSAMLHAATGLGSYADAFEQTLLNHLLGSQAIDGRDFSYYQGLEGRKIHFTSPGAYSCCRYRGMNALAHLPEHVMSLRRDGLAVDLYTPAEASVEIADVPVRVVMETDYPRTGRVRLTVKPQRNVPFALHLRQPQWCGRMEARMGDAPKSGTLAPTTVARGDTAPDSKGYLRIERDWSSRGQSVDLVLDMPVCVQRGVINDRPSALVSYGPLVLAIDSRYGTPIDQTEIELSGDSVDLQPEPLGDAPTPIVKFRATGRIAAKPALIALVDYASAGSLDNSADRFKTWIPLGAKNACTIIEA